MSGEPPRRSRDLYGLASEFREDLTIIRGQLDKISLTLHGDGTPQRRGVAAVAYEADDRSRAHERVLRGDGNGVPGLIKQTDRMHARLSAYSGIAAAVFTLFTAAFAVVLKWVFDRLGR